MENINVNFLKKNMTCNLADGKNNRCNLVDGKYDCCKLIKPSYQN